MKILELFSGTGSIGRVAQRLGHEVVSLDRDLPADIQEDIMTWNYRIYHPGHFDLITASPVCAVWSRLKASNIGRYGITKESIEHDINTIGKPMVDKVREILNYFNPDYFWIENPQSGRMKEYITDLPYHDVDYCKYSRPNDLFEYRKRTRFWTNITEFSPRVCHKDCEHILRIPRANGKVSVIHKRQCGNSRNKNFGRQNREFATSKHQRYRIPEALIEDLILGCH
jgi:hypothetical protein